MDMVATARHSTSHSSSCSPLSVDDANSLSVPCSLKRKRPPTIQIPRVLQEISSEKIRFRDCTPQDDAVCVSGLGVGLSSVKGKKKFMEDTHQIFSCSSGNPKKGFFGVYDGHGGKKAAEFVAENLHSNILEMLENSTGNMGKEEAVKAGYLKTDEEFLKQGLGSGACCVTALIEGKEIVVSNLGDCRAVVSRSGIAEALTKDHRVEWEEERKRIEKKGGYVEIHRGGWRVHGVLSVSRSIGDAHLKSWIMAEPETRILNLTLDMEFLVLASDGLWEKVGNQEAVDVVKKLCFIEKKLGVAGDLWKEGNGEHTWVDTSPLRQRKISIAKKQRTSHCPSCRKIADSWNESDDGFACENESPPSKARKLSSVKRKNLKTRSVNQENNVCKKSDDDTPAGLANACKELINLSVTRGSLDDITVMIIDLNHFRCNSL